MKLIPVVIPAYHGGAMLERCLDAIKAQTYPSIEIFVRDNTHDNIQFTAAVNEGLKKFAYRDDVDHILVLNQDAYLEKDAVARLAAFINAHAECGIACPLQLANGKVTWGGSLQAFPFGVHRCDPVDSYKEPQTTYWANGGAMLIRTAALREVGLFDKNMKFICSDVDFSYSCRARGWKIYVVPDARVEHAFGASSKADVLKLLRYQDLLYFARKWVNGELYKGLAFEGSALTRVRVASEVDLLKRAIDEIEATGQGASRKA